LSGFFVLFRFVK